MVLAFDLSGRCEALRAMGGLYDRCILQMMQFFKKVSFAFYECLDRFRDLSRSSGM